MSPPVCGDGVKNGGEPCDKADLGGADCLSVLGPGVSGAVSCTADCAFAPLCTDLVKNGAETDKDTSIASGAGDGLIGERFPFATAYTSARINWCDPAGAQPVNRFQKFDTSDELFADTRRDTFATTIVLSSFTTSDTFLNSLVTSPNDARFCRAATTTFAPGDTSWGVKGASDNNFACGCNSGGWAGVGSYYGGIIPACSVCSCWGGGWSGSVTNGQQKGQINNNQTFFWVR